MEKTETPTTEVVQDLKTEEAQTSQATTQAASLSEEPVKTEEVVGEEPKVEGLADAVEEVEEYELSRTENTKLSDEDFEAFVAEAEEKGYSKEMAEAILKAKEDAADKYSDKFKDHSLSELKTSTHAALMKDEMFNTPEKYAASIEDAKIVLSHFGDAELAEALKNPVIGSNPAVFKFMLRIAKVMKSEGAEGTIKGDSKAMSGVTPKSFLDSFYPDM